MKRLILFIPFVVLIWCYTKTSTEEDAATIYKTKIQRDICLDWYSYIIDTSKAIKELNLRIETESELMNFCDFFKNIADTK